MLLHFSRAALAAVLFLSFLPHAQAQGFGGAGQQGGGGLGGFGGAGGGGLDLTQIQAQLRQTQLTNARQQLDATEEQWKVIQPKLEKVMDARPSGGLGALAGLGGLFAGGGFGLPQAVGDPATQATQDLQAAVSEKNSTAEQIDAKLKALREAREKPQQNLAAAQKDLKSVVTARQEAVLVVLGYLE